MIITQTRILQAYIVLHVYVNWELFAHEKCWFFQLIKHALNNYMPGPVDIKLFFSYSTQLSTKFVLLINIKMPTIVGILTFISMISTTTERLKAIPFFINRYLSFYEQLKLRVQLS